MDLFKGIKKLEPRVDFTWKRHKVILSNIANADTPNYKAKDLEFKEEVDRISLKTTNPKHIKPISNEGFRVVNVNRGLVGNDRNNVSVEEEMAKLTQNRLAYEVYMKMISGNIDKLNNVIRGGRR
ncbi:flagellar basal-body rod protein FlgB [Hydrogenivirga caldilitoris]|uniref:Flagellar basal body rod protein FlgB n=1 Tax=Hydrogenivirga caldilitoris TaxID=246264 RepID=A0A497XR29_9AQUI|nr:flagellar basal body rod protein FlgB [Hydrogenivirga caldilitoris]RLJ71467.1 flagellar basal-body rod protein FlgB [Hydrogenivirga caldilitoris]